MICAKCGASNPAEAMFCGGCGATLTPGSNAQSSATGFSEQVPPAVSPIGSNTPFPGVLPVSQDAPTLRADIIPSQPAPSGQEFFNFQGVTTPAPAPTPGFPESAVQPLTLPASPSGVSFPAQQGGMPGFPSGATYPVATPVPGSPSGVSFPVQAPATPGFTSGMYPGQPAPSQPNWGVYPGMVPPQQPAPPPNKWIQPLPLWITLTSSIIGASVLAALMFFTGSDWAAGAQIAGIVALVLGLLVLTAFIARSMMGMLSATNARRTSQVVSAIVLTVLLFGYGSFAMFGQNSIHNLQGRALESQQQWQHAIDEYGRAGQTSPTSVDIARTYNEWGQHLLTQTPPDYQGALDKFNKVMSDFAALSDQVTQAQQGATSAYQNLGKQAAQQKHYDVAINQYYTALLNQSYCQNGTNCYTSTSSLEATAYFNLAEQHLSAQDYTDAADAFKHLTTDPNLKGSPEAKQAHGDYAKALLGEGKQALTTTCSSAVPIYQQLAQDFSDTPEGQQAQQALNGPAQVTGHFTSTVPAASDTPFVLLSKTQVTQATTFNQFMSIYQGSPHGPINSDGTFTLSVQPGSYQFTFGTLTNPDQVIRIIFHLNNTTIGPLCFSFGDITDAVPAQ